MKALVSRVRNAIPCRFCHRLHNAADCLYYGIAIIGEHGLSLFEDHAVQMVILGVLFIAAVFIAVAGEHV